MSRNLANWLERLAAAGIVASVVSMTDPARGQTLPIAGNPRAAVAQDRADRKAADQRDGIRGVREQDNAAVRTANRLNRDARQEARQQALQAAGAAREDAANIRRDAQGDLRDMNAMNSGLRGADLGIWFNTRPGMNGLVVADIANQGAFAQAGFREGDRILSINGRPVTTEAQFVQSLSAPGGASQAANVTVFRNGQQQTLTVQPAAVMQGIATIDPLFQLGLSLDPQNPSQLVVEHVFPRTPAFNAGLRPGDVISSINGQPITTINGLIQALQTGNGNLAVDVARNGQTRQLSLEAGDPSFRTAMRQNFGTTTTSAVVPAGSNTINQVDQSGLNTAGTVTPATSNTISAAAAGSPAGRTLAPSAIAPLGTAANPATLPGTPSSPAAPGNPTSPSLQVQPNNISGAPTAVPGVPTAVPGAPTTAGALSPPVPPLGQSTFSGGQSLFSGGQSSFSGGQSTANPALPAFGSPGATGATGTTGGAGSTAGGAGAVGGTGATIGGTGSTAGGAGAVGGTGATPGGAGSTAGPSGGAAGAGAAGGAGGGAGGGAAAGGT